MGTEYKIIRSNRKTIGLSMTSEGLLVRAPYGVSLRRIEKVLEEHRQWIAKATRSRDETAWAVRELGPITPAEVTGLKERAKAIIPERVQYYAAIMGVTPGKISIRCQKTKWGSCSRSGNLNFNCLLLLAPPEVLDAIVVHELCHLKEMNHSRRFYDELLQVYPEYRKWHRWLKDNGDILMKRVEAGACFTD